MRLGFRYLPGVLSLLVLAPWALADIDARDYLDRMSRSFRELDYRGVFTYEYGSHMESMRISHAVRDGVERERLVYLNGESREIIRDGHRVSCIHPGHQIMRLGSEIASGPFARSFLGAEDVTDHYHLTLGRVARIADRPAVQVVVQPADQYRYGFRLFLDRDTALLLKSLTISPLGKVLERFQFVEIEMGVAIADSELHSQQASSDRPHHYQLEQAAPSSAWRGQGSVPNPQWLPPGFVLSARSTSKDGEQSAQLAMYTDGFSTLTLVLEMANGLEIPEADGRAHRGATVAYMRQISFEGRPYILTVVGEVPLMTAKKVARSVVIERGQT